MTGVFLSFVKIRKKKSHKPGVIVEINVSKPEENSKISDPRKILFTVLRHYSLCWYVQIHCIILLRTQSYARNGVGRDADLETTLSLVSVAAAVLVNPFLSLFLCLLHDKSKKRIFAEKISPLILIFFRSGILPSHNEAELSFHFVC